LIRWSNLAAAQFKAIHAYIAKDSIQAARRQGGLILKAIDQLDAFALSGRVGNTPERRELVVPGTPYIVYYRLREDAVLLTSIRHAARLKPRRFTE
jgi:toxin ParE1/3/4